MNKITVASTEKKKKKKKTVAGRQMQYMRQKMTYSVQQDLEGNFNVCGKH